jgi:flagellar biosynthetic protein FliR
MDLLGIQALVTSLLLHLVRVGAFFAVAPTFGRHVDSASLRLVLTVALGGVFWWVGDQEVPVPPHALGLGILAVREVVVGLALGFAVATTTAILATAGEIISSELGFSMARAIDPESGIDTSVVAQLLQVVGTLLLLQFDLHHEVLRILQSTFTVCRVGEPFAFEPIWAGLEALIGGSLVVAVQYAFPILGVMLLLSAGMVLLSRAVPAINLMEFGFALKVLIGLSALTWFLVAGAPFLVQVFGGLLDGARGMFVR